MQQLINIKIIMAKQWINLEYSIDNNLYSKSLLKIYINKFWFEVVNKIEDNQHILFIFRVKFENSHIATIVKMKKIKISNKEDIFNYIKDRLSLSNEAYTQTPISSIIFTYGIREGKIKSTFSSNKELKYQIYYNNKLPIGILPEEYGTIIHENDSHFTISVSKNAMIILKVIQTNLSKINYIKYFKNGNLLFEWKDTIVSEFKFIREIGKSIIHYENSEKVLLMIVKQTKAIKQKIDLPKNKSINCKTITIRDNSNK